MVPEWSLHFARVVARDGRRPLLPANDSDALPLPFPLFFRRRRCHLRYRRRCRRLVLVAAATETPSDWVSPLPLCCRSRYRRGAATLVLPDLLLKMLSVRSFFRLL